MAAGPRFGPVHRRHDRSCFMPGVFGFLVWELKENWRLYEANRSPTLGPVHRRQPRRDGWSDLLRPGFHSGTLPKLYRADPARREREVGRRKNEGAGRTTSRRRSAGSSSATWLPSSRQSKAWPPGRAWPSRRSIWRPTDPYCADAPASVRSVPGSTSAYRGGWLDRRSGRAGVSEPLDEAASAVSRALAGLFRLVRGPFSGRAAGLDRRLRVDLAMANHFPRRARHLC